MSDKGTTVALLNRWDTVPGPMRARSRAVIKVLLLECNVTSLRAEPLAHTILPK